MRKFFIYFPIIFLAIIFQTSAVSVIFDYVWTPNLVLSMIVAWALIDGFDEFLIWAVLSGVLYDLLSHSTVGVSAIVFVLVAYGVSFFSKRFSTEMRGVGVLLSVFFIFSATLGERIVSALPWLRGFLEYGSMREIFYLMGNFFVAFSWNLLFFFVWFFVLVRMEEFFYFKTKDKITV